MSDSDRNDRSDRSNPTDPSRTRVINGRLTYAAEQVNPHATQDAKLINAEIEGLYHFMTTRYAIAFDMLVILLSVAATIGHEAFQPGVDAEHKTPKETLHLLLDDMIAQYELNQKKHVH